MNARMNMHRGWQSTGYEDEYGLICCCSPCPCPPQDLQQHVHAYCDRTMLPDHDRSSMLASVGGALQGLEEPLGAAEEGVDLPPDLPPVGLATEFDADLADFVENAEQQGVLAALQARPYGLHIITGAGGVGKSALMKAATRAFRSLDPAKVVLLCASTGVAAKRLSAFAMTAHAAFGLPVGARLTGEAKHIASVTHQLLTRADIIVSAPMVLRLPSCLPCLPA
jgi:hypothetical protein